jgi:hypothetical protein
MDEERLQRTRYLFNVDWRDPALYGLVLNLAHMSRETAADVVIYLAKHPEYQPTPGSEKELNDLTLSGRVKAAGHARRRCGSAGCWGHRVDHRGR